MPTEDTLNFISKQFHIYFGLPIVILGVIGAILNIIVFTTFKIFRETTCAFYLTTLSIVTIVQLLTALLVRVLSEGFYIGIKSVSWGCKIETYMAEWCLLVLMTVMCLATIDQYVSMSPYRHFSNKRLAQRSVVVTCIFWALYSICFAIYCDAHFNTCMIINSNFMIYSTRFHFPIILGLLPLSTMTTFSLLAFNSIRTLSSRQMNIVRLSRDRQLTAITLVHAVFVVITTLPFIIFFIYSSNQTSTDPEQIARNNLIYTIIILIDYLNYAGSFYIYCCVSKRFRKQLLYVLTKVCGGGRGRLITNWRNNRIIPTTEIIGDIQLTKTNGIVVETVSIQ